MKRFMVVQAALALGAAACTDEPLAPVVDEEEALRLPPGIHSYLTVSDREAPVGATIMVTANLQVVDVPVTIAGYRLSLGYDAEALKPVEAKRADFGGIHVVNLAAPDGVRAAAAAPQGIEGPLLVLVAVAFQVKAPDYAKTLALSLDDVTALEEFQPVASAVALIDQPVLTPRYLPRE
ncbi:MAG: hypothetical protein GTN62_04285 [Gemmatimonadales bacterium]|nr:hypothetical protein [Gemmatimonadales bacterium]NIN49317.1 hypothetical protein [Gemmatimonadales bacterium]NIP06781.1 hypothetical protein [Gemmatimonadales bacterium]NIQ98898.1 hypothetical protein [Gemmatimonadales bacterium]NIS65072.1 hypothetical protein [Gemmatimonadales bacterium]